MGGQKKLEVLILTFNYNIDFNRQRLRKAIVMVASARLNHSFILFSFDNRKRRSYRKNLRRN